MSDARLACVVIGRNEGAALARCLESVSRECGNVVYVDSGSSDGSVRCAEGLGADVVELDPAQPFSAARARNEGFEHLVKTCPDLEYVQFVDGDCELQPGWIETARNHLDRHPRTGVVCGRRRERNPDASPYNRLADIEWNTPVGSGLCGGDAMMRAAVFRQSGGYNTRMIAGEDPELCLRIRRDGHEIVRIDHEMTLHDAGIHRFAPWWKRAVRCGHAFAESAALHGRGPERFFVRRVASSVAWGLVVPLAALGSLALHPGLSLLLLGSYTLLWRRTDRYYRSRSSAARQRRQCVLALCSSKFAEAIGALQFAWNRFVRRRRSKLIEYKT